MDVGPSPVTVVSWNLHGSAGPDLRAVAEQLRRSAADAATLQEVRAGQARRLAAELGWNLQWVFKHYPLTPLLWWLAEGMAILSPHPLDGSGRLELTPGTSGWSYRRRMAQWCSVQRPAGGFRLVNAHLSPHPDGTARRAREAALVAGLVTESTVLAGDLNAPGETDVLAPLLAAGLRDTWNGPGPGFTNPAGAVSQRLDYVFVGPAFAPRSCEVPADGPEWTALSDHLPVIARFGAGPG